LDAAWELTGIIVKECCGGIALQLRPISRSAKKPNMLARMVRPWRIDGSAGFGSPLDSVAWCQVPEIAELCASSHHDSSNNFRNLTFVDASRLMPKQFADEVTRLR
jgi:hypothetical protein